MARLTVRVAGLAGAGVLPPPFGLVRLLVCCGARLAQHVLFFLMEACIRRTLAGTS